MKLEELKSRYPDIATAISLSEILKQTAVGDIAVRELLDVQQVKKAAAMLESAMTSNSDDAVSTVWWVICQLELSELPLSALSSPLERAYESSKNDEKSNALCALGYLSLGVNVACRGQTRLAINLLEQGNSIAAEELQPEIVKLLIELCDIEIDRLEGRAASASDLEQLQKKKKTFEEFKVVEKKPAPQPAAESKKKKVPLSAKSIRDSADHVYSEEVPTGPVAKKAKPGSIKTFAYVMLVLFVLGGGSSAYFYKDALLSADIDLHDGIIAPAIAQERIEPILEPLALKQVASLDSDKSSLSSVTKRLSNMKFGDQKPIIVTPPQQSNDALPGIGEVAIPRERPGSSFGGVGNEARVSAKLPDMQPGSIKITEIEGTGRGKTVDNVRVGPDGRSYGPPPTEGARTLDGQPLRGYQVTDFPNPVVYLTITQAEIMSSPSLTARSLATVEAYSKVVGIARIGRWIEIKSDSGKRGYILRQDLQKAKRKAFNINDAFKK